MTDQKGSCKEDVHIVAIKFSANGSPLFAAQRKDGKFLYRSKNGICVWGPKKEDRVLTEDTPGEMRATAESRGLNVTKIVTTVQEPAFTLNIFTKNKFTSMRL